MDVARKWHFSTLGGAANLGGVSGDLFEHRGSGIPLLGITSLLMHKLTGLNPIHCNTSLDKNSYPVKGYAHSIYYWYFVTIPIDKIKTQLRKLNHIAKA